MTHIKMLLSSENKLSVTRGKSAIALWRILVVLGTICVATNSAISHRHLPSSTYQRRRGNDRSLATTTTINLQENPPPFQSEDKLEEEPLPLTTTPNPTDTLNSPLQEEYPPITPSIAPITQGKSFVRPYRRWFSHRSRPLLPRRTNKPFISSRRDFGHAGLLRWPLQALEEDEENVLTRDYNNNRTLAWWVTNEPQLTLAAPETTYNRRIHRPTFQQPPRTTHIVSLEISQSQRVPSRNKIDQGTQQVEEPPPPPRPQTTPSSAPTLHPPFPSPTTLAEDPAVLQSPPEVNTLNELRQPRWFPLDRLFRMITVGANGECEGGEGRTGVCMLESACRNAGGTPSSACVFGYGNCCIEYKATCGLDIRSNRTYWVSPSPGKHSVTTSGGSCILRVYKISPNICNIRLDFRKFTLLGPQQGSCLRDRLVVSGHNINAFIPNICGENSGQHMYIDVDTVTGPVELNVNTVGEGFTRNWEIEVSQILCNSPYRPPANCLQYYKGAQGSFSSFNYQLNTESQYLNNLNYAICLRKEAGFCSIEYKNEMKSTLQDFEIVNFIVGPTGLATSVVPVGEAGVGLIQCPDDYLILAGTRLCGDRLNDGSTDPQPTNNGPVTDSTNGPFTVQFVSSPKNTGQGFHLQYQQYPC